MARITLRQLLDHAAEHGYGVPAFNINNMEQALAIGGVLAKGLRTADIKGDAPTSVSTSAMGDAIVAELAQRLT